VAYKPDTVAKGVNENVTQLVGEGKEEAAAAACLWLSGPKRGLLTPKAVGSLRGWATEAARASSLPERELLDLLLASEFISYGFDPHGASVDFAFRNDCGVLVLGQVKTSLHLSVDWAEMTWAQPGAWMLRSVVAERASIALGATHARSPRQILSAWAPVGGPPASTLILAVTWRFSLHELRELLRYVEQFIRAALVLWHMQAFGKLAFPARVSSAPPLYLLLLAACRRYGRRAEPSGAHPSHSWFQPSVRSDLAAC
jgi:hypothetical protein